MIGCAIFVSKGFSPEIIGLRKAVQLINWSDDKPSKVEQEINKIKEKSLTTACLPLSQYKTKIVKLTLLIIKVFKKNISNIFDKFKLESLIRLKIQHI